MTLPVQSPEHSAVHDDMPLQLAGQAGMPGTAGGRLLQTAGMHSVAAIAPAAAVVKPSLHVLQAWVVLPALKDPSGHLTHLHTGCAKAEAGAPKPALHMLQTPLPFEDVE